MIYMNRILISLLWNVILFIHFEWTGDWLLYSRASTSDDDQLIDWFIHIQHHTIHLLWSIEQLNDSCVKLIHNHTYYATDEFIDQYSHMTSILNYRTIDWLIYVQQHSSNSLWMTIWVWIWSSVGGEVRDYSQELWHVVVFDGQYTICISKTKIRWDNKEVNLS
jgi:hypothetical protein